MSNDEFGMSNWLNSEFALLYSHFACPEWQLHIGNKEKRRKLTTRSKDAKDPFKIVIVREGEAPRHSWLTGFDAPCLHMPTSQCKATGECRMTNSE